MSIIGYMYGAELFTPAGLAKEMNFFDVRYDNDFRLSTEKDILDAVERKLYSEAMQSGMDRTDEMTFDSSEFPKVVTDQIVDFNSEFTDEDGDCAWKWDGDRLKWEGRFRNESGGKAYFVNVYRVDQGYGGPEEGGWYYSTGEIVFSVPCAHRFDAERVQRDLRKDYEDNGYRYSVRPQGDDFAVLIETDPGCSWPREIPHYE